jgi:hypothetical protein
MIDTFIACGLRAIMIGLAIAGAAASAQQPDDQDSGASENGLALICWGEGRKPNTRASVGYAWNGDSHKFVPQTYVYNSTKQFDSEVQVELHDDWGRIHLAKKLLPSIHSGGNNGWWELENVHVSEDIITARYRLNGLNKPKLTIDRRTGRISIDGIEKFRGECDQGNWAERKNRF